MTLQDKAWTITDELKFIDSMLTGKYERVKLGRDKEAPTNAQKKAKLKCYINSLFSREWDCDINLKDCESYAQNLLRSL